ncbi:hypothetical protein LJR189_004648 [Acidovorax delafieldii]|jgi:hypothetical protein|uniref:hypothetical protein n=1 Tax=Acidovorax delafieldii TaxID=47920 RepID=UPI003ECFE9DF
MHNPNTYFLSNTQLADAMDASPQGAARAELEAEAVQRFSAFARQEGAVQSALAFVLIAAAKTPNITFEDAQAQISSVLAEAWKPGE